MVQACVRTGALLAAATAAAASPDQQQQRHKALWEPAASGRQNAFWGEEEIRSWGVCPSPCPSRQEGRRQAAAAAGVVWLGQEQHVSHVGGRSSSAGISEEEVLRLCSSQQLDAAVSALEAAASAPLGPPPPRRSLLYAVLRECMAQHDLTLGRRVHALAARAGYESHTFLGNQFVRMYAAHGRVRDADAVFARLPRPDAFSWSAIIAVHARHGDPRDAVRLYRDMRRAGAVCPDNHVLVAALQACAAAADLETGRLVHADVDRAAAAPPTLHVWNGLVHMYAKCGRVEEARAVFDAMPRKDVVSWNAMMAGYAGAAEDAGAAREALALYDQMMMQQGKQALQQAEQDEPASASVLPTAVTLACVITACGKAGALAQGRRVHAQAAALGLLLPSDTVLGNCLVDMYAKCGDMDAAEAVFGAMPHKDVVSWTSLIDGYGQASQARAAVAAYHDMVRHGVRPNEVTWTCVLAACGQQGLVDEGRRAMAAMAEAGQEPTLEHRTAMVDLLARAGQLDDAEHMLAHDILPGATSDDAASAAAAAAAVPAVTAMLGACRSHGDVARGERWFRRLVRLDPANAGAYTVMAGLYADAGCPAGAAHVERMRREAGAHKKPAVAGIEVGARVHTFVVGGGGNGSYNDGGVKDKAVSVDARLKRDGGLVPRTELVLKPHLVTERDKEEALCGHAEKLALAFGLMHTPHCAPLLVTKNLRMCANCHASTEVLSRIETREITVRDSHRIHKFVNGSCHCGGRP